MVRQRVMVTRSVPEPLMSSLRSRYEVEMHDGANPLTPEKLRVFVRGAHAIVSITDDKMTGATCATPPARSSRLSRITPLATIEHEPRLTPGLAELDNVVLTPHLASSTAPVREAMGRLVAESVAAALSGKTPPNLVEGT